MSVWRERTTDDDEESDILLNKLLNRHSLFAFECVIYFFSPQGPARGEKKSIETHENNAKLKILAL